MKRSCLFFISVILIIAMLAGCAEQHDAETTATVPTESEHIDVTTQTDTEPEEDIVYEGDAASHYIDVVYHEQIGRYYTALSEKWNEGKYFENGLSASPYYYYEGDPLENVGFGFMDLDNDGSWELVIGAIMNAEADPSVFEIWTLVDEKPVMLAQGGSGNRYVLQFLQEDNAWYVVNEASNGAASSATYSMMLLDGKLEVTQGIIFDATVDENNPWYMTYDLDWDVTNDDPIDEDMANAILDNDRRYYTAIEYIPYNLYK